MKVLIVEDETPLARAMMTMLKTSLGWHDIVVTQDGQEAWDRLMAETYDLIISDWSMPRKTGDALLAEVRQHEKTRHMPFLMITAYATKDRVRAAIQTGVSDYLVKPFAKQVLVDTVRRLVADALPVTPAPAPSTPATAPPLGEQGWESRAGGRRPDGQGLVALHTPSPSPAIQKTPETPRGLQRPASPSQPQRGRAASSPVQDNVMHDVVRHFKSGATQLPVLPEMACTIIAMLKEEEVDFPALEKVLAADPSITTQLIGLANSSYYSRGGGRHLTTLAQAMARLGMKPMLNHVFTMAYGGLFKVEYPLFRDLLARLLEHSLATGIGAQRLAWALGFPNPEGFFTLGLLHDIGKVILVHILADMSREQAGITMETAQKVFKTLHEEFGAAWLTQWHFPPAFTHVALYHHALSRAADVTVELQVVHVANLLVRQLGYSLHEDDGTDLTQVESAVALGLDAAVLRMVAEHVREYVEAFKLTLRV